MKVIYIGKIKTRTFAELKTGVARNIYIYMKDESCIKRMEQDKAGDDSFVILIQLA